MGKNGNALTKAQEEKLIDFVASLFKLEARLQVTNVIAHLKSQGINPANVRNAAVLFEKGMMQAIEQLPAIQDEIQAAYLAEIDEVVV